MKKLLSILGAIGLIATTGSTVIACSNAAAIDYTFENDKNKLENKDDKVVILITAYSSLTNVQVTTSNEAVLTITQPDTAGKITVTAAADTGSATVTITADGKSNAKISFTIGQSNTVDISTTIDKSSIEVNQTATITVTNYAQLTNLKATANPSANVGLSAITQGKITVTGKAAGNVTITLTADNAKANKTLSLTVTLAQVAIQVDQPSHRINVLQTATINIVNINALDTNSLTAEIKNASGLNLVNLDASQIRSGIIKVSALSLAGNLDIAINASNATAEVLVHITISLL